MIEDPDLFRLFKAESEEHLASIDDGLLRLEKNPADAALLEAVFRESHSLKGAARMLGLGRIENIAHELESALNAARKGESPITPAVSERLSTMLGELRRHVQQALSPPASEPEPTGTLTPPAPPSEPVAVVSVQSTVASAGEMFHIETVRVETHKLDALLTQVGELAVTQVRAQHRLAQIDALLEQWTLQGRSRRGRGESSGPPAPLLKQIRDGLFEDSARLEFSVNQLEDQVHSMRLLPLSTVFSLFPRMTRDLARQQGKEVDLQTEGGEICVDKRVLEEMKDPLMHLIRNAIDHGIELPGERTASGKPACGTIGLSARVENGQVSLEVRDDGRGLDLAAIRREAVKRGLGDVATIDAMSAEHVQQLIFSPGFTTSTYVTALSGRGVGLDVVRINVERMKGAIRLKAAPGRGVSVHLQLPISRATTRLLLACVSERLFGLPVEYVLTSRRVSRQALFSLDGRPAILLDGQPIIAVFMSDLLELPERGPEAAFPDSLTCIVLQIDGECIGMLVDDLLSEEEVVPKPLGPPLQRVRNVSALAMLGSGDICPVLNPVDLLRSAHKSRTSLSRIEQASRQAADKPSILLVEDSALIRAMEQRILTDAGYRVVTAVDGVDALHALTQHSFAGVVSDIMMPNMDGLTLTGHLRADTRYRHLPVILVTTLATDEDKQRGLEVGANAYIPKPSFDQCILLDTLKRLIAP